MEEETPKEPQVLDLSKIPNIPIPGMGKGGLMDMDFEKMEKKADKIIKVIIDTHEIAKENRLTLQAIEETFEEMEITVNDLKKSVTPIKV